ncbi:hypothetical protein OG806_08215 [Streptomyces sp. NBC_00882]|uniref:hypothetical protein n=1 Tax=Streptomyces sp. NBC_00882 TaxID=2975856 RepID=UPI00386F0494|nr:hypothetical protein OG806_08215 [Streptomyces sp. NBC_00882]
MVDWPVLVGAVVSSFVAGLVTAWRYAITHFTKIWVEDLRHRYQVKKEDREKHKQIRHEKLDEARALEITKSAEERKRIVKVRRELERALHTATQAESTYASTAEVEAVRVVRGGARYAEVKEKRARFEELLSELRGSFTTLAKLGVRIDRNGNWNDPYKTDLQRLILHLSAQAENHARDVEV